VWFAVIGGSRQAPTEAQRKREDEIFNEWKVVAEHGGGESVAAREMAVALAGAEALVEAQNVELAAQRDVVAALVAALDESAQFFRNANWGATAIYVERKRDEALGAAAVAAQ
jgi:hypothetical protein